VFYGPDGLRAGWSLLLYLVLLWTLLLGSGFLRQALNHRHAAPQPATITAPPQPNPAAPATPEVVPAKGMLVGEGMALLCVLLATWTMAKIERRSFPVYGLGGRRRLPNLLAGLGWGATLLSLLVFSLRTAGLLVFDARLLFGGSVLRYGCIWLAGFLCVGLFEECFFRGYLQYTLARGLSGIGSGWLRTPGIDATGFWIAAVLLSFGFGFVHKSNTGESPIGLLSAGLIAVVFCLSLWRTGSLWWAIGFHASWDWAQSFLFGVADSGNMIEGSRFATHAVGRPILSGGLTGPEGSVFILPIVGLTTAIILLTLPQRKCSRLTGST
jgi:membrane protease YdiL (CAAX protease family)